MFKFVIKQVSVEYSHFTMSAPIVIDASIKEKFGLCLLSLDGGDTRSLSTLLILQDLMNNVNTERAQSGVAAVKPCEIFDLIGGTGVGG